MSYSINDVAAVVDEENLGFAILEGVSPSSIRDDELSHMWEEARDLLIRIQEYLDNNNGTDDSEDEGDG